MLRWILLFAIAFLLSRLLDRSLRFLSGPRTAARPAVRPAAARPAATRPRGRLVPCAHCGVLIEESRALADSRGGIFCSAACREPPAPRR